MKKALRAIYDNEYKTEPAEEEEQQEQDILDSYMEKLMPKHESRRI